MVGKDGWKRWLEKMVGTNRNVGPNPILIIIGIHRICDGWNAQFKKRQTYLA
jgi:hypothetical protein